MMFLIAWTSLGPIFIIFLFLMDIVFILNTTILEPLAFVMGLKCDVRCFTEAID